MLITDYNNESKIWIFGFDKKLSSAECNIVSTIIKNFTENWMSHNKKVNGTFVLLEKRFLMLITDDKISGCSIDSSVNVLKEIKSNFDLDALNPNLVFYRFNGMINACDRNTFQLLCSEGQITPDTPVFNLMLNTLGDWREQKFELPFHSSWHSTVFKIQSERANIKEPV